VLRQTGLSRGNLSVQMGRLEEAGMVHLDRQLEGRRPRTTYTLSERGLEALGEYKRTMLSLLAPFPD
jgi:DNA-binding transcriptional ArsR family regulator